MISTISRTTKDKQLATLVVIQMEPSNNTIKKVSWNIPTKNHPTAQLQNIPKPEESSKHINKTLLLNDK